VERTSSAVSSSNRRSRFGTPRLLFVPKRDLQRRYAAQSPERVSEAEELDKAGTSLAGIGDVLKVNQSTVWHALTDKRGSAGLGGSGRGGSRGHMAPVGVS
jgi:hypothetical protein